MLIDSWRRLSGALYAVISAKSLVMWPPVACHLCEQAEQQQLSKRAQSQLLLLNCPHLRRARPTQPGLHIFLPLTKSQPCCARKCSCHQRSKPRGSNPLRTAGQWQHYGRKPLALKNHTNMHSKCPKRHTFQDTTMVL